MVICFLQHKPFLTSFIQAWDQQLGMHENCMKTESSYGPVKEMSCDQFSFPIWDA